MGRLALVAAVGAAAAALASAAVPAKHAATLQGASTVPAAPSTVLAAVPSWKQRSELLVRLDARTLKRVPGLALKIGVAPGGAWSPDHRRLALAGAHGPVGTGGATWPVAPQLRLVDVPHARVLWMTRIARLGATVDYLNWLGPEHILVLVHRETVWTALVVDARTGHVTRRVPLPMASIPAIMQGWITASVGGDTAGVLLFDGPDLAPARLVLIRPHGARQLTLPDVPAGPDASGRLTAPGLALSPDGTTAYAMSAGGPVEEVDTRTLAVTPHPLATGGASLLSQIARALQPAAEAKELYGSFRCLAVTPSGQLLVTGSQLDSRRRQPAGLTLVDPATWASSLLSADVSRAEVVGPAVVGMDARATGLQEFRAGAPPFTALAGRAFYWTAHVGTLAYAWVASARRYAVVDLARGAVTGYASGPGAPAKIVLLSGADATSCVTP